MIGSNDEGYVFQLAGLGNETPIFFSNIDLSLARPGAWKLPFPIYALANWANGGGLLKANSLKALVAMHLKRIREIQPEGPYRLGGYSLGGVIAFEIAQQLESVGQDVELLFLLDPMVVPLRSPIPIPDDGLPSSETCKLSRANFSRRIRQIFEENGITEESSWLANFISFATLAGRKIPFVSWLHYKLVNQHLKHPNKITKALFPKGSWSAFWYLSCGLFADYVAEEYFGPTLMVVCDGNEQCRDTYKAFLRGTTQIRSIDATHMDLFKDPPRDIWMAWLREFVADREICPSV